MIWADRFGLGVASAIAIVAFAFMVVAVFHAAPDDPITPYDLMRMVLSSVKAEILVALPVWVAVRTIDFVMGGPARRRKHRGERKDP
jgi:hypothetical protein